MPFVADVATGYPILAVRGGIRFDEWRDSRQSGPATAPSAHPELRGYSTFIEFPAGTTLMLLNGEPLISFVLTTV